MKILGVETGGERRQARAEPGTLGHLLERNAALRDVFAGESKQQARLAELQAWQSQRLMKSHDDLHRHPRYRLAIEFFFNELYGSGDPRARDRDLIKVQRVMEKPAAGRGAARDVPRHRARDPVAGTGRRSRARPCPRRDHRGGVCRGLTARRAGAPDRERQIALTSEIGGYLDHVVRKPIVRALVRLARRPAHAAGFGLLQKFLERGLDAFEAMAHGFSARGAPANDGRGGCLPARRTRSGVRCGRAQDKAEVETGMSSRRPSGRSAGERQTPSPRRTGAST
ncbi:MAG: hypothetical protein IPF50_15855 [Proteobacteria bacterium]|nr:hypothetical protein [Pseudomonadota bacterium]